MSLPNPEPMRPADEFDGALPSPPRPAGLCARRRAWNEPTVRFWWLASAAIALVALYLGVSQSLNWWKQNRLFSSGLQVEATIIEAGGVSTVGRKGSPEAVVLRFTVKGQTYSAPGSLPGTSGMVPIGSTVNIRVDLDDPHSWTSRQEAPSLARDLLGTMILLPLIPVTFLVAWLGRRRFLRTWKLGQATAAVVVDFQQSALAPRSRRVRCSLPETRYRQLVSVFVPQSLGPLKAGDTLQLVCPPHAPAPAVVARLYQQ